MSGRIGQLGAVGLALESSWGVPATPSTYLEVTHADIRPIIGYDLPNAVRGTRARRRLRTGGMVCSGALSLDVSAGAVGELLKATFGTVTTTLVASTSSAAVYQHTFTRCDTTFLPSLTVEQNMGGLTSRRVSGVRVNQLALSLSPARVLTADADCRGREEALITPTSPTYSSDEPLHYHGFSAQVNGVANRDLEEFLVRFNNALVDDVWAAGGSGKITKLPAGNFSVGGRFTMAMESTAAHQAFVNGEAVALTFRLDGATLAGTWGYGFELDLPKVRYFTMNAPLAPGRLVYDLAFESVLDTSRQPAADAACRLWNTTAAY